VTLHVRHPATLVFALFASLYLLTYQGVSAGDDLYHLVAMKGWLHGRLSLPEELGTGLPRGPHAFFVARGLDGRPHLSLPPGLALLSLPLGGIGERMDDGPDGDASAELAGLSLVRAPAEDIVRALGTVRERPVAFCAGLVNPIVTAATVTLFYVTTLWLGAAPRATLASTFLLGMSTIVWPYATSYWSQPIAGFCLLAVVAGLLRFEQTGRLGPLAWAGLACGYGVLTRTELLLVVPWAALYLRLAVRARPGMRVAAVAAFAAPLVACALLWAGWNWLRFGDWLQTGSIHQRAFIRWFRPTTLLQSVPAQLLSFQRSLFVFSPPLLLALAAWPALLRRHRTFGTIVAGVVATLFVFYSAFIMWSGQASWGPRFLVPLTALLMLPVGAWLEGSTRRVRTSMALGAVGALVQLAVALPGYRLDAVVAYWTSGPRTLTALLLKSDLVPQLRLLLHGEQDVWWLWNPGAMVAALVLAAIVTSAGIGLLRTTET
jgi:hypothetical protein